MLIIIGFLFTIFIFVLMSAMTGMPFTGYTSLLLDMPTTLLTLIFLFFFLFTTKSGSIIGRYIKSSFKKGYTYTKTELKSLSTAIKNTVKFIIVSGVLGFFVGVIASLMHLENKDMLGPNMAVSLYTVIYSIAVSYFVFFPVQAWAENKINALENDA